MLTGRPVRQMAAVIELQPHRRVARRKQGKIGRDIRLCAGVRLHIRVVRAEQRLGPLDRELLHDINELAAAVVALARVTLGVLIGQHRAHRRQHRLGRVILGSDQFETILLSARFALDRGRRSPHPPNPGQPRPTSTPSHTHSRSGDPNKSGRRRVGRPAAHEPQSISAYTRSRNPSQPDNSRLQLKPCPGRVDSRQHAAADQRMAAHYHRRNPPALKPAPATADRRSPPSGPGLPRTGRSVRPPSRDGTETAACPRCIAHRPDRQAPTRTRPGRPTRTARPAVTEPDALRPRNPRSSDNTLNPAGSVTVHCRPSPTRSPVRLIMSSVIGARHHIEDVETPVGPVRPALARLSKRRAWSQDRSQANPTLAATSQHRGRSAGVSTSSRESVRTAAYDSSRRHRSSSLTRSAKRLSTRFAGHPTQQSSVRYADPVAREHPIRRRHGPTRSSRAPTTNPATVIAGMPEPA